MLSRMVLCFVHSSKVFAAFTYLTATPSINRTYFMFAAPIVGSGESDVESNLIMTNDDKIR